VDTIILKAALWAYAVNVEYVIVFSGHEYIVIRMRSEVNASGLRIPTILAMSPVTSIDSDQSIVAVIVYILLVSCGGDISLPWPIEVPVCDLPDFVMLPDPDAQSYASSPEPDNSDDETWTPSSKKVCRRATSQMERHLSVPRNDFEITLIFKLHSRQDRHLKITRASSQASSDVKPRPQILINNGDRLIVTDIIGHGATGIVYRSSLDGFPLAIKVSINETWDDLRDEVAVYEHIPSHLLGSVTPHYFGAFQSLSYKILVLEFVGTTLTSFDVLSEKERYKLFKQLRALHKAGIEHGDFCPQNVAYGEDRGTTIIDFSHAIKRHRCLKKRHCPELIQVAQELGLSL